MDTDELEFTSLIDLHWWQNQPDERIGLPVMLRSNFVNGVKHLRATYTR